MTFYNELDRNAAAWLRSLAAAGHISPGEVNERSIADLTGVDCKPTSHFFAGIGGWDYALRLAGWPADRPVWTGSCPCQPFSAAGKRKGAADERHLWPAWFRLIRECHPPIIFGEQVAAAVGHGWLDGVFADLEGENYACGAVVLGAHSVGAPHIRQRLYWVAVAQHAIRWPLSFPGQDERDGENAGRSEAHGESGACSEVRALAIPESQQHHGSGDAGGGRGEPANGGGMDESDVERRLRIKPERDPGSVGDLGLSRGAGLEKRPSLRGDDGAERPSAERAGGEPDWPEHPEGHGREQRRPEPDGWSLERGRIESGVGESISDNLGRLGGGAPGAQAEGERQGGEDGTRGVVPGSTGRARNPWADAIWLPCRDGKTRRFEPESFPLAYGLPGRVGRLRGYGNAIVPQVAAEFIRAVMEVL